jgi:hypothetical protein
MAAAGLLDLQVRLMAAKPYAPSRCSRSTCARIIRPRLVTSSVIDPLAGGYRIGLIDRPFGNARDPPHPSISG